MASVKEEFQQFQPKETDFSKVSIDEVKSFWDARPCNLRHSPEEIGTKEYFDQVEARKYKVEPHIAPFAEFPRWNGKRVLEVGCGLGTESINFARAGAILTIVEVSAKSLELCKKRFEVYGLTAEFFLVSGEELDSVLGDEYLDSFDLVWSFGVIHHTPNPSKVVDCVRKFLKPQGEFRFMVYSRISYKLFFIMKETGCWDFSKVDSMISTYSEAQSGCPVTYSYSFDQIRDGLLSDGFRVDEIKKAHIFCYDIEAYRNYRYEKEECWKNVSDEDFQRFEEELGWHTLVTAVKL